MTDVAICENCEKNDGCTNSKYWLDEDCDVGYWVCWECEMEIEQEYYELLEDIYDA